MKHSISLRIILASLAPLIACASTELPESTIDVDSRTTVGDWSAFKLGPNDLVYVTVFGEPEFSTPETGVRVSPGATLSIPLLGPVAVGGRSADEVAQAIEAGLATYLIEPSVTVSVMEYSSRRFYLLGEVEKSGPFVMDRPISALEAITMGEGFKTGANREQVVVIRRHGEEDIEVIPFNAETPGLDGLVQVRPDDLLFVGKAGVGVFSESFMPYVQIIGLSIGQTSALAIALDRL